MSEDTKTAGQELQERLGYEQKNAWLKIDNSEKEFIFSFCEGYKDFLNKAKTERESVEWGERVAKENGFVSLESVISQNRKLNSGEKVYSINRGKNIILVVIGNESMDRGLKVVGRHIDAPRIDLKPNPLYEDSGMSLFKTHYYGGIKKYQWTTIPLALHGVVIKSNGEKVNIVVGEDDNDPQFVITELLPHLAQDQMQKKMSEGVTGEGLNVLAGSMPYNEEKLKEKIKLNILEILNSKYGIAEEDFLRAELEIVPAFKARDIGFDRSMVGSYGQDDRVCSYAAFEAILKINNPAKTAICLLTDKEEIGSMGNTGSQSKFFENTIAEIISLTNENYSEILLKRCFANTEFLSGDVTGLVDPTYADVNEKRNSAYLGNGVHIGKYGGARGKSGSSDANAEFLGKITNMLNDNKVIWQSSELGKVDMGGGGTIAQFFANYGMEVVDIGTGVLSMHSPYEIASKVDIYMTYKAYLTFYNHN